MKMQTQKPLPPDPEEQNADRASWADAAIKEFILTTHPKRRPRRRR